MPVQTEPAAEGYPRLRIGAVVEETGLTPHVIRVWERRYGAIEPDRTDGGSRLYSRADVDKLRLLGRLTGAGHAIGGIARLPIAHLLELSRAAASPSAEPPAQADAASLREAFMAALERLDGDGLERVLVRSQGELAPREVISQLVAPLANEIGRRWEEGRLSIAQEHAATARLRDLLTRMRSSHATDPTSGLLVAATLSGEEHELGLLMASVLAAMGGWGSVYLGTNLPAAEVIDTVLRTGARLLVLSMVRTADVEKIAVLKEMRERLPASVEMIIGGRAAPDVAGLWRPRDLADFERKLKELRRRPPQT